MNRERIKFFEEIFSSLKTLVSLRASLEEGMQAVVDIAVFLGVERICIFLKDENVPDLMVLKFGHPRDEHGLQNKISFEKHPGLKEIMERKKILIIPDSKTDPRTGCLPNFCDKHGINATLFMRLEIEKMPIGAIVIDAVGEKTKFTKEDISAAKHLAHLATKKFHNAQRIARQAEQDIMRLAAMEIAHELKNPLTSIGAFAERLKHTTDEKSKKKYLDIITTETGAAEKIIDQVNELLKQKNPKLSRKNLNKIVTDVIAQMKTKVEIKFGKENKIPTVYVDEEQVKIALSQFLKNALDAIEKRGMGEIFVRTWKRPHFVCVEIANTGSYIRPDDLKNIFTPFYTSKGRGHGLGLAIAQQIVEMHKGYIEAHSQKGPVPLTTFTCFFPLNKKGEE